MRVKKIEGIQNSWHARQVDNEKLRKYKDEFGLVMIPKIY